MKNKKIIRLTENDINKFVKKIIVEGSNEEQKLINKAFDLLVGYGYYQEEELPQDLEELNDILWSEWQKSDSIMKKKFDDLMYEIESYFSGYGNEDDYMDDDFEWAKDSIENLDMQKNTNYSEEMISQAEQVATEDVDAMSDDEVADYLGIEPDEVNWDYRNDAIEKRIAQLLEIWSSAGEY
jgi:hypothetical protein